MENEKKMKLKSKKMLLSVILLLVFSTVLAISSVYAEEWWYANSNTFDLTWDGDTYTSSMQHCYNLLCVQKTASMDHDLEGNYNPKFKWRYQQSSTKYGTYGSQNPKNTGYAGAYILYHTYKHTYSNYTKRDYQKAWWRYLGQQNNETNELYNKAILYSNFQQNSSISISNLSAQNGQIVFTVNANTNYNSVAGCQIKSIKLYKVNDDNNTDGELSYTIQSGTLAFNKEIKLVLNSQDLGYSKIRIAVDVSYNEYGATAYKCNPIGYYSDNTYHALNSERVRAGQPIIKFVPERTEKTLSISTTVNSAMTAVSLQKYIIGVNIDNNTLENQSNISHTGVLTTAQTNITNRKDKNATKNTDTSKKINAQTNAGPNTDSSGKEITKFANPVKISYGDMVTYQIEVYNNSATSIKDLSIQDYLQLEDASNAGTFYGSALEIGSGKDIEVVSIYALDTQGDQWYNKLDGNSKNATITDKDIKVHIDTINGNKKVVIRITLKINKEIANTYKIRNFAKILNGNNAIYRTMDADFITMLPINVSLQKYITEINDAALTDNDIGQINNQAITYEKRPTMELDRINLSASNLTPKNIDKDIISDVGQEGGAYGTRITHKVEQDGKPKTPKFFNPVIIEKGDVVTYHIHIYNNSNAPVSDLQVEDYFSVIDTANSTSEDKIKYIKATSGEDLENENNIVYIKSAKLIKKDSTQNLEFEIDDELIQFAKFSLEPTEKATIELKAKINYQALDHVIRNYTYLRREGANYRKIDADYVVTRKYAVSLEKFVSKVNDEPITGRDGKRNNTLANDKNNIENYNEWKPKNMVPVEPGDFVTFTIRLKNTGNTNVKIKSIYDTFTYYETEENNIRLVYDETYGIQGNGRGRVVDNHYGGDANNAETEQDRWKIEFDNAVLLNPGDIEDVTIRYRVDIPKEQTANEHTLRNIACIIGLENKNNQPVSDSDGTDNNRDRDFLVTKTYAVSLQKFVQAVNGKALATNENRADLQVYSKYVANQKGEKDNNIATWNGTKWRNPVVVNKDDFVTYEIQVTNDGDTYIQSLTILDKILGEELAETGAGIEGFYWGTYDANKQIETEKQTKFNMIDGLAAGETKSIWITLKVSENNIALDTLTNHAEIENNEMKNKNGVDVIDTTKNNNADEDYIVLDDIVISGIVWNDKANGKQQTYNGIYDKEGEDKENPLEGIKVSLYRRDTNLEEGYRKIAETTTNNVGKYTFDKITLQNSPYMNNIPAYAKFIKAPKTAASYNYWKITNGLCEGKIRKLYSAFNGFNANNNTFQPAAVNNTYGTLSTEGYYAYYIEFEYDGIKYTTSVPVKENEPDLDPSVLSAYDTDEYMGNVQESFEDRRNFNNKFATITADGAGNIPISYITNNTQGFVPESNYIYDSRYMAMKSSTDVIQLAKNTEDIEAKLQHVNIGLKGRDIFDLDISTNVYQTEVTVNGVSGVYQFENEIHLRGGDIRNVDSSTNEDMTNLKHTPVKNGTDNVKQPIRKTDINGEETNSNYTQTGLQVKVTYVLTIQNSSATYGTATQVTDYYDNKYDFVKAYSADGTELTANNGRSGTGYKSVVITTPGTELATSEWMDIYVELNLRDAENLLKSRINNPIDGNLILKTFNIAEIDSYKTSAQRSENGTIINSEFTRGLIDKDSAPGSINKETVRTTNNEGVNTSTVNENQTTLEYYYSHGDNLLQFKAEDDTGAAPVLYFMASNDRRTLTGIVFEDKTITNTETRVKTGNGKLDEGENGVYGATVELVEIPATSEIPANIAENFGEVRYQVETGANGNFTIEGFLPGNYLLRYRYGDTVKTALLHQNGNVNKLSYNGEDYQSTNNIGAYNAAKLNEYSNYWYIINETEGVSTGTDNAARRNTVRENVTGFEDSNIIKLNNMKDLIGTYSEEANGTLTANKKYNADRSEIVDIDETKVTNVNGIIEATKMYASTPTVRFELEKPIVENTDNGYHTISSTSFGEYNVNNMNFGIAEVPLTIVKFNKEVQAVTIIDSTNSNVLAAISRNADGTWSEPQGAIVTTPVSVDIAIEEDKLQGAHLQATYAVKTGMILEINFDESESVRPTITGMIDFIDNNLSYHPDLSYMGRANSEDWEITTFEELKEVFIRANNGIGTVPKGTVDPEGIEYTTILKAKENNAILLKDGQNEGTAMITLERILSATDSTIEETLLNTIDGLTYNNTVELTGITITTTPGTDPDNPPPPFTDRIRTQNGFIIRPGSSHDATKAETIIIHPPTGNNSMNTMYFVLAIISLGIIAIGAFGIKRYVVNPRS